MAKFSSIIQGTRARRRVQLPLGGARMNADGTFTGNVVDLDLRPLLPGEIADVAAQARAYANEKGQKAEHGDETFEMAVAIFTVHAAALDADSAAPTPFFDVPARALFKHEGIAPDAWMYLYEQQVLLQSDSDPRPNFLSHENLEKAIERMGGPTGDDFFFSRLRPAARWTSLLFMVNQLAALRGAKSGFSSASAESGTKASRRPAKKSASAKRRAGSKHAHLKK